MELWSQGGADIPENVIGLCNRCHKQLHSDAALIYDEEISQWLAPLDAASHWLVRQIEKCPVRLDNVQRNVLFQEIELAVESVDGMIHHSQAIYNSNHWCTYEVFLKAAWAYLDEIKRTKSMVAAIILLKMVQLYRRRAGRVFQSAAARNLLSLKNLLALLEESCHVQWIKGVVRYEEAYMKFLTNAAAPNTEALFEDSEQLERKYGRPIGSLVSRAQLLVARMRQSALAGSGLDEHRVELLRVQEKLAGLNSGLASSWVEYSIPMQVAYANLVRGRNATAIDGIATLADKGATAALWYRGIAMIHTGELELGTKDLKEARRAFYRECRTEQRADLLVGLGDAYALMGERGDAEQTYNEALKQPAHMDNREAINKARERLSEINNDLAVAHPNDVYFA